MEEITRVMSSSARSLPNNPGPQQNRTFHPGISCVHDVDPLTGTGGNSDCIRDIGIIFFLRDPLLICLGRGFTHGGMN